MSLADNKRSIFTTIGSYNSLMEQGKLPLQTDLFPSINNKNDTIPFLLDVLKVVGGSVAVKESIGKMFTTLVDEAEPKLKTALKKQFIQSNADEPIPTTFMDNGITVPVSDIDVMGKFRVNPNTTEGNLIYGEPADSFDGTAYDAILNAGDTETYNNLDIKYIESTDSFQIKPNGGSSFSMLPLSAPLIGELPLGAPPTVTVSPPTIGDFFTTYIDNTELINRKELMSSVMDNFYGTLMNNQNKTVEQIYNELLVQAQLEQLLVDGDDSFVVSPEQYDELLAKARELAAGEVNYDLGCGLMAATFGFNDFNDLITSISGATDPYEIGDQIGDSIIESTSGTTEQTTENLETIKDGFFQRLINIFVMMMLEAVTTAPQIRVLLGMMSSLQNNGIVMLNKASEDLKNFKTMIKCMANEIMVIVSEFIFLITMAFLVALLKPVIKEAINEQINQNKGIILSLINAFNKIKNVVSIVT